MVYTSQSVPSTQVVSSVVAPAMPLPDHVAEEPLAGLRVLEEGFDAKAGKTSEHEIASRNIILNFNFEGLNFSFEGIALLGCSAEIVGHNAASPSRF